MTHYMLPHHASIRTSAKIRPYSYRKVIVDTKSKRGEKYKVIEWEVYKQDLLEIKLGTLKEVTYYIETRLKNDPNT